MKLLIVADDQLTRAGLAAVLQDSAIGEDVEAMSTDALSVVESADDALLDLIDLHQPDLLLWDLGWDPTEAGPDGQTGLERLAQYAEMDLPILCLIPHRELVGEVWRLGVHGLLSRSAPALKLTSALSAVAAKLHVIDPAFADEIASIPFQTESLPEPLTPRENEVLALLAEGMTNRAIGRALGISEHTAKFHVQALLGKLGAQSRTEVVVRATRMGLLTL